MHNFQEFYSSFTVVPKDGYVFLPLIIVVVLWMIILKGYALWHSARNGQKKWFIALIIPIHILGILDIIYLVWFRPKNSGHDISETPVNVSSSVQ